MNPRRALCGMLITAGAMVAGTAFAADPEGGKVDAATPRVDWKGSVTASWVPSRAVILADAGGESGQVRCEAPTCDSFALEVGEKRDLTVGVTAPEPDDQVILRIKTPADEYVTTVANADAKGYVTVRIKGAAPGPYVIDYWNYYVTGTTEYTGYAQLAVPGAPATTTGPTQPQQDPNQQPQQTNPNPQPQPQTGPQTTEAIALSVKVGKTSAKKLKKARKLKAKVTVSRPATLTGVLKKGKKTIGKGKAVVQKSGTLTLKVAKKTAKKLKKGKYVLTVVATDGKTSTSKKVTVKVRK